MAANAPMGGEGDESGGMDEIHIAADQLPQGIKEGDMLVCTSMDEAGCSFRLEKSAGGKGGGMSWEDEARQAMSPRNKEEGAM
jgi:hypothetical protein